MVIDGNVENMRRSKVCYVATCERKLIQNENASKKKMGKNPHKKKTTLNARAHVFD